MNQKSKQQFQRKKGRKKMKTTQTIWFVVIVTLAVGFPASAVLDLTDGGSEDYMGATFTSQQFDTSTGTGVFQPFVRVHVTGADEVPVEGIERGYNTDGEIEFETKDENDWTHSIQLQDVPFETTPEGRRRYEFRLDINQNQGGDGELLSLEVLEIYLVKATGDPAVDGMLSGYPTNFPAIPAWDLGAEYIKLDYSLYPGSGNGDMVALIPLNGSPTDYVYLYSQFGPTHTANDGFEEWGVIPEPATMLLLGLGGLLIRKRS
jgi:hypothetical protein